VHYTALSFTAPDKVRFQIKLEGQDLDWQDMENQRTAYFHDLEPRDYVFRVRAANNDGVWNEESASLAFTVQPFYWQTAWFRSGVSLSLVTLGAGVTWSILRRRHRIAREEQARYRQVVEGSPNAMITVDEHGRITMVNEQAQRVFGYTHEELIGLSIETLVPEDIRARHPDHRRTYMADPQTRAMGFGRELFGRRKDGSAVPVEIGISAIRTSKGMLALASVVDITERLRAEQAAAQQRNELAHLSRVTMLGELSGSMAHELNQPLTAILTNAEAAQLFAQRDGADMDEIWAILADIGSAARRAGEIIQRLRLLLKKGEVSRQPLEINEMAQEVLKLMRSDLISHQVMVETRFADGLPQVLGDRVQLQQVLINLITNACDAMAGNADAERLLVVQTQAEDEDAVRISVRDRGIGIAAEKLEAVFESFYTSKPRGMGLGLSVCRTIVSAHRGRIFASSNTEDGTCFHVIVPAGARELEAHRRSDPPRPSLQVMIPTDVKEPV
jgi:two-component system sensor kinase FixL